MGLGGSTSAAVGQTKERLSAPPTASTGVSTNTRHSSSVQVRWCVILNPYMPRKEFVDL